mgnify:FL=1
MYIDELKEIYEGIKPEIQNRLQDFRDVWNNGGDKEIFIEIAFCVLTPQSKAVNAWSAINKLIDTKLLFEGKAEEIAEYLNVVRFKNTKAENLVRLREIMMNDKGEFITKQLFSSMKDSFERREWIVANVRGMGWKEASHFLRNVGFGEELAILDRHILRNMERLGVIESIPKTITGKSYLEMEAKLRTYVKRIDIPMDEMDLLLWYKEAGEIFK